MPDSTIASSEDVRNISEIFGFLWIFIKWFFAVLLPYVAIIAQGIAAIIAISLFFSKRKSFSNIFKVLLNYTFNITLSELKSKIESLNDLKVNNPEDKDEILNIIGDIVGQINGNPKIKKRCSASITKLDNFIDNPESLTEPQKRSVISELKERLRGLGTESYEEIIGGKNE